MLHRASSILGGLIVATMVAACGGGDDAAPGPTTVDPDAATADGQTEGSTPDTSTPDAATETGTEASLPDSASEGSTPEASSEASSEASTDADATAEASACGTATQCALAAEQKAADKMATLAAAVDPADLGTFLSTVPKGGDLHNHLSGAVYAETYMEWARDETTAGTTHYCITNSSMSLSTSCGSSTSAVPLASDALFIQVVRAWSMQDFVAGTETGEDHFFATFGKFGAISGTAHHGKCLADAKKRAASENELYLEPMLFSNSTASSEGSTVWTGGTLNTSDLPAFHAALLADGSWSASVQAISNDIQKTETNADVELDCGGMSPPDACDVKSRYMVYISRSGGAPGVFAQMVAAFEAAEVEPRLVALNLVGPEDGTAALNSYDREMEMLGYLHTYYDGKSPLHVTLHAGELATKYMPTGFTIAGINHIRKAVEVAHAERIGHGVDVLGETNSADLITELQQLGVMVEIGLSSNIQILEVNGAAHPLSTYLQAGVPVALATDDQAVSRSSMAGEYMRAVKDQNLDYRTLKKMARTSLHKSFAPGQSLWTSLEPLTSVSECSPTDTSYYGGTGSSACQAFLTANERARMQWELERRFTVFEAAQ
jgi:adenosine deaminase